ncbi:DUF4870 domain-containing protein, partial [Candidatus Microgenomates bacterium]
MAEKKSVTSKSEKDKDERLWATFCHLSAFVGFFIPLGNIIAPLI